MKTKKEAGRYFVYNLDDAYFQIDMSCNITYINPAAPAMFGYSSTKEMLGMPVIKSVGQ